jgi:hypothetical protein
MIHIHSMCVSGYSVRHWNLMFAQKVRLPCFAFSEWMYRDSGVECCQFINCCSIIITNFESFEVGVKNLKIACICASNVLLLGKMYCVCRELFHRELCHWKFALMSLWYVLLKRHTSKWGDLLVISNKSHWLRINIWVGDRTIVRVMEKKFIKLKF